MKLFLHKFYILITVIILIAVTCLAIGFKTPGNLKDKASKAFTYCNQNGYNTKYCLLVDYGRHSGRVRFFLWDFEKEKPILKSLCAHGYGKQSTARHPVFSNEKESFCSSIGHYKVGKEKTMSKPKGRKALFLYGKDSTNSNAYNRGILIHPVSLPNITIYPLMIPVKVHKIGPYKIRPFSEGCITIPFKKYKRVTEVVKSSTDPILLWVYK